MGYGVTDRSYCHGVWCDGQIVLSWGYGVTDRSYCHGVWCDGQIVLSWGMV